MPCVFWGAHRLIVLAPQRCASFGCTGVCAATNRGHITNPHSYWGATCVCSGVPIVHGVAVFGGVMLPERFLDMQGRDCEVLLHSLCSRPAPAVEWQDDGSGWDKDFATST